MDSGSDQPGSTPASATVRTAPAPPAPGTLDRWLLPTALALTVAWGFNFVVIKVGIDGVPPLLLAALRFVLVAVPAVFFVRRPAAPPAWVAAYGLFLGVGEFGLLFTAIKLGAPVGVSSLVLQSQAFFTALLAAWFLGEPFRRRSVVGMLIAGAGLALLGLGKNLSGWGDHAAAAFIMLVLAALMWAVANVIARRLGDIGALSLIVWSSLAAPLPLFVLSLIFEGRAAIAQSLRTLSWLSVGALAYLVVLSTLIGYSVWNHLIVKHGAGRVAPFSMLVPIFGVSSGAIFLHERFTSQHVLAALLVLVGLAIHATRAKG
ncbi:MAG TPA: EamA family transporter [Polyangia bacterium]|nr:EamA family transporter [Polyangia bacterium]